MDSTSSWRKKQQQQHHHHNHHPSTKKKKKEKGRTSKADLARRYRTRSLPEPEPPRRTLRPIRRRRGLEDDEPYFYEYDEEEDEVEETEQKKKKKKKEKNLTVVLKLNRKQGSKDSSDLNRSETSSLEDDRKNKKRLFKRRRINGSDDDVDDGGSDDSDVPKEGKRNGVSKSMDSVTGLRSGPSMSTPLPDRKTLELILHKLQKKDTYGVYAEPVDPEELPDYHDMIEHPMDFGTVRKKLASGAYTSFEQFEGDVFLVCTNAMRYNAPETIYYKQAHAIQELAKMRFEKLRVIAHSEMELKSLEKTKANSVGRKSIENSMSTSAHEPVGSDFSSGATLANTRVTYTGPNAAQAVALDKSASADGFVMDGNSFLDENKHVTSEEPSVEGFQSKLGRNLFVVDENRRSTYDSCDQPVTSTESVFATFEGEMKQLVIVGLHAEHSYARSLARFAATLGPVAWRIASQKIERALPAGYKFGRGWVGEYEPLQTPVLLLENHFQRQPAYNLISQLKSASNKVQEIAEKPKVTQDGGLAPIALKSDSSAEAGCNSALKPYNIDDKLACFGIVAGTNTDVQDMCLQQQNSLNKDFAKFDLGVLNQTEVSYSSAVSNIIPNNASQKLELNLPKMTSRLQETVSRNRNVLHSVPFKQREALEAVPSSENASQSNNGVRINGGAINALSNVRTRNALDGTGTPSNPSLPFVSNHQVAGALSSFGHSNSKQALDDPVKVMMLSDMTASHPKSLNSLLVDSSQVLPPVLSSRRDDSYLAAAAVAKAWMLSGAQGLKLADSSPLQMKIAAASLYNRTREFPCLVSRSLEDTSGSGMLLSENRFAGQSVTQPVHVGEDLRIQKCGSAASYQSPAADLSRFPMKSPWRGLVPHYPHRREKAAMPPPDLNISFQPSGSPVQQQSSGVHVDSQQPDLALQL